MTYPFRSIIGTAQSPAANPPRGLNEPDERKSFAEALAEDIRAEELAAICVPRTETHETSEQSASAEHVETGLTTLPLLRRSPLCGGKYTEGMRSQFSTRTFSSARAIKRRPFSASMTMPRSRSSHPSSSSWKYKTSSSMLALIKAPKLVPGDKFWKENPKRHQRKLVFKPGGATDLTEYNIWRGFGLSLSKDGKTATTSPTYPGSDLPARQEEVQILIRSLAWMVQNPDKHAGVVIILKSRKQGTGKSTLGKVMLDHFRPTRRAD